MGNNDEDSDGHSADLEEEEKQRKEEVSDYETIKDWVSPLRMTRWKPFKGSQNYWKKKIP